MPTFIRENRFTKIAWGLCIGILLSVPGSSLHADWAFDFSRRQKDLKSQDLTPQNNQSPKPGMFDAIFSSTDPVQEIVILHTETGFVPSTVHVREGQPYRLHVVNINSKDRNVSFVLDAFSEHHATYYGLDKSFLIQPRKDGVFSFQCPETAAQGKLVVYPQLNGDSVENRKPANKD